MATFKKNVIDSIKLAKADINVLKEWVLYLNEQVEKLKNEKECDCSDDCNTHIGAKKSKKVHTANCPFAKNIKPENKISFNSLNQAFNQGFSGCQCVSA